MLQIFKKVVLLCVGCLLVVSSLSAQETPPADFIFIGVDPRTQDSYNNKDIYYLRSDGSLLLNLTDTEFESENRAYWNADGSGLIFSRNSVVAEENGVMLSSTALWEMTIDDNGNILSETLLFTMQNLFNDPTRVENWYLSPDKTMIFFSTFQAGNLYLVDIYAPTLITLPLPAEQTIVTAERWSKDGESVNYVNAICPQVGSGACDNEYWEYNFSSREFSPSDFDPVVAIDEANIVVQYNPEGGLIVIWDNLSRVIENGVTPALSPDGQKLAYGALFTNQGSALSVIQAGAISESQNLISSRSSNIGYPSWSPDGQRIAFYAQTDQNISLNVINVDGSGAKTLKTHRVGGTIEPMQWRP